MRYWSRDEVERIGRAGSSMWVDDQDRLAFRYLSSYWLYVERDDKAFTPHGMEGFWEAWITAWVSRQFDEHEVFIDVGANVGYYTLMAAKHGMTTMAFEPNPRLADMLWESVKLNRCEDKVNVYRVALGDSAGMTRLVVPEGHSGGAHISDTEDGIDVSIFPLDSVAIARGRKVLIKIDAEGAEPEIWAGMSRLLLASDVTVFLEWESCRYDAESFAKSLMKQPYVALINYKGDEERMLHYSQLVNLGGLQTVVVRNFSPEG